MRESGGRSAPPREQVRTLFGDLGVWERAGERAPHKPLLLLLALARYARGGTRLIPFAELEEPLLALLREFGPPRQAYHPNYPFWYLRNDGVWQVTGVTPDHVRDRRSAEPTRRMLREAGAEGGLVPELFEAVRSDPQLLRDVAADLLDAHFPGSLHEDILAAVGIELVVRMPVRDPRFRERVLLAYGFRCAVCGFDARLRDALLGVEAAHIQWHQAGGPSRTENGLALCSLHHKLFDRGAITLTPERRLEVSQLVNGGPATDALVTRFHGDEIALPPDPAAVPAPAFIEWHREEVFRGPGRWMEGVGQPT